MASILNDPKDFDAFSLKPENEHRFGPCLPTDSEIAAAVFCGTLEEAYKEYRHIFDYHSKG